MGARSATGEVYEILLAAQLDTSDWQLCLTWCRLPRMMETMVYMGLRAIWDAVLKPVVSATPSGTRSLASLHYRSDRISLFGWTMTYKLCHLVGTLPSDEGDYTSLV
eukprot:4808382-Pleurochrysis_carterae.AAC.1